MSTISTHVLDTAGGRPAAGVPLTLEVADGRGWRRLGAAVTDDDGRAPDLLPPQQPLARGVHRLTFDTGAWFAARQEAAFYPEVTVVFEITGTDEHYHVPLLLSPYGYSTYRGS